VSTLYSPRSLVTPIAAMLTTALAASPSIVAAVMKALHAVRRRRC
jgi:hypothetical protein